MRIRARFLAAGAGVVALALGVGVAAAQDAQPQSSPVADQPQERKTPTVRPIDTVASLERAERVALDAANGGSVESIDRENGGYEVEVRKAGGAEHEILVDGSFRVVANEREDDRDNLFERDDEGDDRFERDDD